MHRYYLLHAEQRAGARRTVGTHGESIADRKERDFGTIHLSDQAHVAEERGIAGVIDRPPILEPEDETARLAHVGHLAALDEAAAVAGVGHRYDAAGDLLRAPFVHRQDVLDTLAPEPVAKLVD